MLGTLALFKVTKEDTFTDKYKFQRFMVNFQCLRDGCKV